MATRERRRGPVFPKGGRQASKLPLEGIRVADFGWVVAAPGCTRWLAMMGAEVIRVESNRHLDILRRIPPFADGIKGSNRSGVYNAENFSKRSCTLDLTRPKAAGLALRLMQISDIVVENFTFGLMEHLGLGFSRLRKLRPDLILASSSGFGRTGPYRAYAAWNEEFFAYSGLSDITGYEGGPPEMVGGVWADRVSAIYLTVALLAALRHRQKTGQGQVIDISMVEAVAVQIPEMIMDYAMNGRVRGRIGNRDDMGSPHGCYPCRGEDRWVAIAVSSEEEWKALCRAMGRPEWIQDERFGDAFRRWKNQAELDSLIGQWTRNYTAPEVTRILQEAGVAAGPSFTPAEVVEDPHLKARGFLVTPDHLEVGARLLAGLPWKLSARPPRAEPAPLLGQHNEHVFCELLGLSDEEFASLADEEVIY